MAVKPAVLNRCACAARWSHQKGIVLSPSSGEGTPATRPGAKKNASKSTPTGNPPRPIELGVVILVRPPGGSTRLRSEFVWSGYISPEIKRATRKLRHSYKQSSGSLGRSQSGGVY